MGVLILVVESEHGEHGDGRFYFSLKEDGKTELITYIPPKNVKELDNYMTLPISGESYE